MSKRLCLPVMLELWGITPKVSCHALDTARVVVLRPCCGLNLLVRIARAAIGFKRVRKVRPSGAVIVLPASYADAG